MFESFMSAKGFIKLVAKNNRQKVMKVLQSGYNINSCVNYSSGVDYQNFTGLTMALRLHRNDLAEFFLKYGAKPNHNDVVYCIITRNIDGLYLLLMLRDPRYFD